MRRIIERKVTVVTTSTWTISWQDAPPQPSSEVDPFQTKESNTDVWPATPAPSAIIERKETDSESNEKSTPTKAVRSYSSKPKRK